MAITERHLRFIVVPMMFAAVPAAADGAGPGPLPDAVAESRTLMAGGFAGFAPAYEGSDEYRAIGFPLAFPTFNGGNGPGKLSRLTFRSVDDVRIAALRFGRFDAGPTLGYAFGREENDAQRLAGLGDIDGGLSIGLFGALRVSPFVIDVAVLTQVTGGDVGHTVRVGAGWEGRLAEHLTARASLSTAYASGVHMDALFSVTSMQSAASAAGLPAFDAEAGFKNVGLDVAISYAMTERWTIAPKVGYAHLLGDAADSPVTASKHQFSGGVGLTYRFGHLW